MNTDAPTYLSDAVRGGEWTKARHLAAIRVAEMMEQTESPRETKALAVTLDKLLTDLEGRPESVPDAPLFRILAEADEVGTPQA